MKNNEILSKIESMMPFLSNTEKRLGNYIIENPTIVVMMSTNALAKQCEVSEPTVIRFTRKIGLSGYKEFKLKLSANIAIDPLSESPINVATDDTAFEIFNKLASFTISSIKSTSSNTLSSNALESAVDYIYEAAQNKQQIFLTGMGASSLLAKEFQIKLMRLNIVAVFYEDIHLRLEACTNLSKNDLLICFTALGHSRENHQMIDIAKANGANIIAITQFGNTKVAEKATVTLYTSILENNLRLASQTSIAVQSMIIETLFLSLALKDYDEISSSVKKTRKLFKELGYYTSI